MIEPTDRTQARTPAPTLPPPGALPLHQAIAPALLRHICLRLVTPLRHVLQPGALSGTLPGALPALCSFLPLQDDNPYKWIPRMLRRALAKCGTLTYQFYGAGPSLLFLSGFMNIS